MPKLWEESIDGHRQAVREAVMEAAWQLAEEHGPLALTMSQVAKAAGIGRATLYKYFPDVESILIARHTRHVEGHLRALEELRGGTVPVGGRLVAVVHAYASICFQRSRHSSTDVAALVHRGPELAAAERRLLRVFSDLIDEAATARIVRTDLPAEELAEFCLHALAAAGQAQDLEQVGRLAEVVLDGLGLSSSDRDRDVAAVRTSHDRRATRRR